MTRHAGWRLPATCLMAWLCLPLAAMAQARPPAAPQPEPPAPALAPPPYEADLMRLAEILGSLAFLDALCGAPEPDQWRARMTALLDAEATTPQRRERLAGAYNHGYRSYAQTYRRCTDAAGLARSRYAAEGGRLAGRLTTRFGR